MDDRTKHIDPKRLFALAEMALIVDQLEWDHIQQCDDCGAAFMILKAAVEQSTASKNM